MQKCCSLVCAGKIDSTRKGRVFHGRKTKPRTYHLRHRDKHGSAFDRDWRMAVFQRDNFTCQHCGARGGRLNAHHIKPFKAHPELRHDLANGQTLCVPCHKKTDTYGWANYHKAIIAKRMGQEVLAFA